MPVSNAATFYDELAPWYHLIFEDWERSSARQADALAGVLGRWPMPGRLLLDAAAGVGTQTLGLAALGYRVVASDLSVKACLRCRSEAGSRGLSTRHAAADFRALPFRSCFADAVLACDNALPHLPSRADMLTAISELVRCVRPGGGVIISVRDYQPQPAGTIEHHPYGERVWQGKRYRAEQEWHWTGESYSLLLRFRPLDGGAPLEFRTTYFAIPVPELLELMRRAGLQGVERLDDVFYQPLLVGTVLARAEARGVPRRIAGFHRDERGDWVADLECGHPQHVRHDPPWMERAWVTTEAGRRSRTGAILYCVRCADTGCTQGS